MQVNMKSLTVIKVICAVFFVIGSVAVAAQDPQRPDRVFVNDLEGVWMNDAYVKQLRKLRMPHQAAKKAKPVVIAIKREGNVYPYLVTDFTEAALMVVLALEPDIKPDSYRLVRGKKNAPTSASDATYVWFKGKRDHDHKFRELEFKEPFLMKNKWADFEHVGMQLGPVMNSIVLSGKYKDDKGRDWSFSDEGQAVFPDKTFYFEVSINDKKARCEYLEAEDLDAPDGKSYYGYVWKAGKLQLFNAELKKNRVRCDSKPFAVLTPQ